MNPHDRARLGDGTRAVRAGLPDPVKNEPTMPGPVFAAHFHLPGDVEGPYTYGRDTNPTWTLLERAIGELEAPGEEVETVVFASGMAAVSAVLLSQARAGDTVVLPDDGYQALPLVRAQLEAYGVHVRTAPTAGEAQLAVIEGARLLWIETPSNPGLDVCDVRRLAEAAHAGGTLVAVDNTLATPLGQRPLALGADFSVASGTKGLTGHGDVLLGYVSCRDPELAARVRQWRKVVGAIPGPMEAWLAHRSLATLQLRTHRQWDNALAVAEALADRADVTALRYPGLPTDPSHQTATRQMSGHGSVVSFTLPDRAHAERFMSALHLVEDATSFGGVRSTAERRGRWGGDAVPDGFIRFSAGAEDTADLVADVLRALDHAGSGA
ncbi:cystathionine gamma-lyase [Streptomyces sp. NBC_00536]|uniref:cystathionine gamma-lyase n=1 Tax=Streptomyces sp. NBC_00536 TaxID=2975769 RepID=UPI002E8068B1|nr:cystathionine gamma-lyase [Streptomyces sp. NBC_00536]WUC80145.1 cystathionine gamma-lyase [Streptomyces sp. NBC_00536]